MTILVISSRTFSLPNFRLKIILHIYVVSYLLSTCDILEKKSLLEFLLGRKSFVRFIPQYFTSFDAIVNGIFKKFQLFFAIIAKELVHLSFLIYWHEVVHVFYSFSILLISNNLLLVSLTFLYFSDFYFIDICSDLYLMR